MTPIERTSIGYDARTDPCCDEESDGLGGFRGLRSALIIEALAVGAVWMLWNLGAWVAAWWRE